jgi:hypothetical protein
MAFRDGAEGYFPKPGGARYTLVHRDDDELVPLLEIEKALLHLEVPAEVFWSVEDHTLSKATGTQDSPEASSKQD